MAVKDKTFVLKNGSVLHPDGKIARADVLIVDGKIRRAGAGLRADEELDVEGCYVLPGLIDLHTHGIGMVSTDRGRLEDYAAIEASRGATTFYPTLFGPPETSVLNFRRDFDETDYLRTTPQIGGFRLESPYLARTGGGVSKDLAPITGETTRRLLDAGEGFVKIWDVSPELPGRRNASGRFRIRASSAALRIRSRPSNRRGRRSTRARAGDAPLRYL